MRSERKSEEFKGWLNEKTVRRRLGGFINSELSINGTTVNKLRAELKFARKQLKVQFSKRELDDE